MVPLQRLESIHLKIEKVFRRKVVVQLPNDLPLLHVDGLLIEQVFVNLFENAGRYTPEGTEVMIRAALDGKHLRIAISDLLSTGKATDNNGGTDTATLTLGSDIVDVNDAPVATDDTFAVTEDTPVNGNVLANDSDVDGDTLTVTSYSVDTNGDGVMDKKTVFLDGLVLPRAMLLAYGGVEILLTAGARRALFVYCVGARIFGARAQREKGDERNAEKKLFHCSSVRPCPKKIDPVPGKVGNLVVNTSISLAYRKGSAAPRKLGRSKDFSGRYRSAPSCPALHSRACAVP